MHELADRYFSAIVLRPASRETYQSTVRIFTRDTGIIELEAITPEDVLEWRNQVIQRGSFTTWNTYRRGMKTMFNFAVRKGWATVNPFLEVKPLTSTKRKRTVSNAVLFEALQVFESGQAPVSPGWFWSIAFKLLFYSGIRRRQLTALRWRDINFERETMLLSVEGSKTRREWEIPIPAQCLEDIQELYRRTRGLRKKPEDRQMFCLQLFDDRFSGVELTPRQVSYVFRRVSQQIGKKVTPHRLRHTMATQLAQGENPDLKSLQYILGHSNISVTLEYVQPEMSQLRLQQAKLVM